MCRHGSVIVNPWPHALPAGPPTDRLVSEQFASASAVGPARPSGPRSLAGHGVSAFTNPARMGRSLMRRSVRLKQPNWHRPSRSADQSDVHRQLSQNNAAAEVGGMRPRPGPSHGLRRSSLGAAANVRLWHVGDYLSASSLFSRAQSGFLSLGWEAGYGENTKRADA